MLRIVAGLLLALISLPAFGQAPILQGGAWTAGRVPMYFGTGSGQATVQDSGPAGGGASNLGIKELLLVNRGTGTPPYSAQGTGPGGTNFCNFDAPTTNATGYHYICMSPNATVAGVTGSVITASSGGAASALPLYICSNGSCFTPAGALAALTVGSTVIGSGTSPRLLNDNSGVLGEVAVSSPLVLSGGAPGSLSCPTCLTPSTLALTVGTTAINSGTAWGVLYNNNGLLGNTAAGTAGYAFMGNGAAAPTYQAFTSPLTGGVARTWQSKAQEIVSLKDFGAVCDGGTDDSTAIQAAITALPSSGGTILVPATGVNCTFGSTITTGSKRNVVFQGQSSVASTTVASSLVYTGSGTRVFDARDSNGWAWNNLSITVTNNAFSGTIIDCGGTNPGTTVSHYCALDRVTLNGNGTNTPTCFNASEAVEFIVNQSNFNACDIGIRGQQVLGQSTVGKVFSTQFFATKTMPISDCGESWSIIGSTFEQLATSNNAGAISINSARPCKNITIQGNWFGDANTTGTWIALSANGASITGNRIANGAVGIAMTGGAGYSIRNNNMENTTAFSCASSPTGGEIASNVYSGVTTYVSGTCVNFNIQGVSGTTLVSQQVLVNATSGSITLQPVTGALGTRTISVPAASGTMAVSATTPITLSAAGDVGFAGVPTTDIETNATYYICFLAAASGNNNCNVDSAHLTFNPLIPSLALGSTPQTNSLLYINGGGSSLTGTNQFALNFQPTFSSAATANGFGLYVKTATANASFSTIARQLYVDDMTKGAASTITTQYQLYIVTPTKGSTNWSIYSEGGASYNGGTLSVGTTTVPGTTGAILSSAYVQTGAVAVGSLPTCNATQKAARHFVTDANATFTAGIGAVVAAGGSNNVPVVCDGTNWRIGANDNDPNPKRKYA